MDTGEGGWCGPQLRVSVWTIMGIISGRQGESRVPSAGGLSPDPASSAQDRPEVRVRVRLGSGKAQGPGQLWPLPHKPQPCLPFSLSLHNLLLILQSPASLPPGSVQSQAGSCCSPASACITAIPELKGSSSLPDTIWQCKAQRSPRCWAWAQGSEAVASGGFWGSSAWGSDGRSRFGGLSSLRPGSHLWPRKEERQQGASPLQFWGTRAPCRRRHRCPHSWNTPHRPGSPNSSH